MREAKDRPINKELPVDWKWSAYQYRDLFHKTVEDLCQLEEANGQLHLCVIALLDPNTTPIERDAIAAAIQSAHIKQQDLNAFRFALKHAAQFGAAPTTEVEAHYRQLAADEMTS